MAFSRHEDKIFVKNLHLWKCQGLGLCNAYVRVAFERFYRAMHFSAKRGIAIACRLSVCL